MELMCGLVGVYNTDGRPADARIIKRMMDTQRHRGPDDQGLHLGSLATGQETVGDLCNPPGAGGSHEFGVGFNRLSIIDLSSRGHQPMLSSDGMALIAYNGEVYNAPAFRSALEARGYGFRGHSDTEVILNLYCEHGINGTLERLNGMFAFCLADFGKREIILARDRLGIKPLYVWEGRGTLLFSSEVKSFLQHPSFRAELDADGVDEFMMFRYRADEKTLLKGVRQIPPGHFMRITPNGMTVERYWSLAERNSTGPTNMGDAVAGIRSHIERSVSLRLISDVTLGCQLSGGLDSSLLSVISARNQKSRLDAISITFADAEYSEERWMEQVREVEPISIHKFDLEDKYFVENFERATWHLDQPINHPNSIGILKIADVAKPLVTVLLSGEGADELLAGYPRFATALFLHRIAPAMPLLSGVLTRHRGRIGTFLAETGNDLPALVAAGSAALWPTVCRQIKPDFQLEAALASRRQIFAKTEGDFLGRCVDFELQTYLRDILVRQDKMTMAHSIEARVPYLDHELVEYARTIPSKYLAGALGFGKAERRTKRVLKETGLQYFGNDFVYRKKSGFSLPLHRFFNASQFVEQMEDQLLPGIRRRGLMNADAISHAWRDRSEAGETTIGTIWMAATFEMWAQKFLAR
jgi:asparagine synthase (glutamine-hydrolysing)